VIEIETVDAGTWRVTVTDAGTTHTVTLSPDDHARLAGDRADPEVLIRASFEFLLEREPATSILGRFDLPVIARYFPEYEDEIARRL